MLGVLLGAVVAPWDVDVLRLNLCPVLVVKFVNTDVDLELDMVVSMASVPSVTIGSGGMDPCVVSKDCINS